MIPVLIFQNFNYLHGSLRCAISKHWCLIQYLNYRYHQIIIIKCESVTKKWKIFFKTGTGKLFIGTSYIKWYPGALMWKYIKILKQKSYVYWKWWKMCRVVFHCLRICMLCSPAQQPLYILYENVGLYLVLQQVFILCPFLSFVLPSSYALFHTFIFE
jgi:hypothetical protein